MEILSARKFTIDVHPFFSFLHKRARKKKKEKLHKNALKKKEPIED